MDNLMSSLQYAVELLKDRCSEIGVEHVSLDKLYGRVLAEDFIWKDSEDENVIEAGTVIDPVIHGIVAKQGCEQAKVFRMPMIGIALYRDRETEGGQKNKAMAEANRFLIADVIRKLGVSSLFLGTVSDDMTLNEVNMKMAVSICDAIIVYDDVHTDGSNLLHVIREKSTEVLVDHVDLQPGAANNIALIGNTPVFGITGDSAAISTAVHLLVVPIVKRICGYIHESHMRITVELANDYEKDTESMCVLWGKLDVADGVAKIHTRAVLKNCSIEDLRGVDVFAIAPAGSGMLERGTLLDAFVVA